MTRGGRDRRRAVVAIAAAEQLEAEGIGAGRVDAVVELFRVPRTTTTASRAVALAFFGRGRCLEGGPNGSTPASIDRFGARPQATEVLDKLGITPTPWRRRSRERSTDPRGRSPMITRLRAALETVTWMAPGSRNPGDEVHRGQAVEY
jgi:hypothetical protein